MWLLYLAPTQWSNEWTYGTDNLNIGRYMTWVQSWFLERSKFTCDIWLVKVHINTSLISHNNLFLVGSEPICQNMIVAEILGNFFLLLSTESTVDCGKMWNTVHLQVIYPSTLVHLCFDSGRKIALYFLQQQQLKWPC